MEPPSPPPPVVPQAAITAAPLATLRFLSYNVFVRPPGIKNSGQPSDYKDERLSLLRPLLTAYDVIGLQECFSKASSRQEELMKWARTQHFTAFSCPATSLLSGHFVDNGLVIMTKHDVIEQAYITYKDGCGVDRFVGKGSIYAKIRLRATPTDPPAILHVFNTHLQAGYNYADRRDEAIRASQLAELRAFAVERTAKDAYPVVMLGDFNVNSLSTPPTEYNALRTTLTLPGFALRDVLLDRLGAHPITHGDVIEEGGVRRVREPVLTMKSDHHRLHSIDYLWILERSGAAGQRYALDVTAAAVAPFYVTGHPFGQLSDHYGVEMTCNFVSTAAPP